MQDDPVGRLQTILPPHQIDVIIGSLLGDARLECRSQGKRHPISARLRIQQSEKQKEYVFWKYAQLENLVSRGPRRIMVWHDPKRNKDHYSWYFHTKTLVELGELHHYFYRNNEKVLPEEIFQFLTPRSFAVWFMDDGSNNGDNCTINTHCFSRESQERIIEFLKNAYGITATIVKDRTKWKIAVGRHSYQKLFDIIKPFIAPSMIYKVCSPRNDFAFKSKMEVNLPLNVGV